MADQPPLLQLLQPVMPMRQLNYKTYWYNPDPSPMGAAARNQPELIILGTWMNAKPRHIIKYVIHYAAEYTKTPLLLLTSSTADFFLNTTQRQRSDFKPAIEAILSRIDPKTTNNSILVHALSNGGGGQISLLSKLFFELHGRPLPARAVILDSVPGRARLIQGLVSISPNLPRLWLLRILAQLVFGIMIFAFYILPQSLGGKNLVLLVRDYLNNMDYLPRDARRCYIYSVADKIISTGDVEEHALDAKAKAMDVETVCYQDSGHVEHMREDAGRYWAAVRRTWEK
jgi:hypothetical protein